MANWKYHLDIKDIHKKAEANEIQPHEYAKLMADRIDALIEANPELTDDNDIQDAFLCFDDFANDEGCSFNDTDEALHMLYDWGD